MQDRAKKFIFFLLIFFISSQVGLHFWPEFSYVHGIRIDYLSPTLYFLDILIIVLFLFSLPKLGRLVNYIRVERFPKLLLLLFILSVIWNLFLAKSPEAHLFGIIKFIEFFFLALFTAYNFKRKDIPSFIDALSLSAIVSSVLAIWQFLRQESVGGLWYFLGERIFNISTIGISTVNLDSQILRPYGTFPHPNVLAFFLFATIVFSSLRIVHEKKNYEKIFLSLTIFVSSLALILTFSRTSLFLLILFSFYIIYTKAKTNTVRFLFILFFLAILVIFYLTQHIGSNFFLRGIDFRQELFYQSFQIFVNNLYFGIGINNFFIHQAQLITEISPVIFQPPHNIFVLAFLQLGIFGFWIFPAVFVLAIRSLFAKLRTTNIELKDFYRSVLFVLLGIIIVGMFDHFFLTLEQGQIILAIILGLSFARLKS